MSGNGKENGKNEKNLYIRKGNLIFSGRDTDIN